MYDYIFKRCFCKQKNSTLYKKHPKFNFINAFYRRGTPIKHRRTADDQLSTHAPKLPVFIFEHTPADGCLSRNRQGQSSKRTRMHV